MLCKMIGPDSKIYLQSNWFIKIKYKFTKNL